MLIGISDQMGTRFDRLRYEVFQNLILSPMNTGLLRPAVAIAPTVYGIETRGCVADVLFFLLVAIAPTVYGIETNKGRRLCYKKRMGCNSTYRLRY